MKAIILFFLIGFVVANPTVYSQKISGKFFVTGFSKDGTVKEKTAVQLFKSFKEDKYKIGFNFIAAGSQYPPQIPLLFDMMTTVKKDGKVIGTSTRPDWPWIPGDMFMPAEAFDFIPMLQKDSDKLKRGSRLNKLSGSYEIILEMKVSSGQDVSGAIAPVTIFFKL